MERIGHYTIVSELGRGGMGVVYKAHEESLNRYVAIKVLGEHLCEDDSYVQRFVREAQSAAQLSHPNLVQIFAISEEDGKHYFVMEYVSGTSLQQIMRSEGTMEAKRAARIVLQTAAGLRAAHNAGVIHRDIKPGNIMITDNGLVKIADFGLALMAGAATRLTATGMFMGTPGYLSPEQCLDSNVDHRTDIYSLGFTFFEMLTGSQPFKADSPLALLRQIIEVEPPDVRELNPDVDDATRSILLRMMAKDRDQRYSSCDELIADLQAYLEGVGTSSEEVAAVAAGTSAAVAAAPRATSAAAAPAQAASTPAAQANADATRKMETRPVAASTEPAAAAPPPPPPASQAPPTQIAEPPQVTETEAAEPQAATPPPIEMVTEAGPERRSRTGLVIAAIIIIALLGVAAIAAVAWKTGVIGRTASSVSDGSDDQVATLISEDSGATSADAEATAGSALSGPQDDAAVTGQAQPEATADGAAGPVEASGTAATSAGHGQTAAPPDDMHAAGAPPTTSASTGAGPRAAPPRHAPPPPPPVHGTVVVGTGERLLAGEAEAFVERALGRRGVRVVDERAIPEVMDLAGSGAAPQTYMRALRPHARYLVLINADYLGDRPLHYMGRVEPAHQSRLTLSAFDLVEGRSISKTWNEKLEYTQLTVGRVVEEKLGPGARKLSAVLAD